MISRQILTVKFDQFPVLTPHLQISADAIYDDNKEEFKIEKEKIEIFNTFSAPFSGKFSSRSGGSMKLDDIMKANLTIDQYVIHKTYLSFHNIKITVDVDKDEYGLYGKCKIFGVEIDGGFTMTQQEYKGTLSAKDLQLKTVLNNLGAPDILQHYLMLD